MHLLRTLEAPWVPAERWLGLCLSRRAGGCPNFWCIWWSRIGAGPGDVRPSCDGQKGLFRRAWGFAAIAGESVLSPGPDPSAPWWDNSPPGCKTRFVTFEGDVPVCSGGKVITRSLKLSLVNRGEPALPSPGLGVGAGSASLGDPWKANQAPIAAASLAFLCLDTAGAEILALRTGSQLLAISVQISWAPEPGFQPFSDSKAMEQWSWKCSRSQPSHR